MVGTTAGKSWTASQSSPLVAPLTRTIGSESIPPPLEKHLETLACCLPGGGNVTGTGDKEHPEELSHRGFYLPLIRQRSSALLQRFTEFHGSGPTRKASDLFMLIRPVDLCLSTVFCFSPCLSLKPM